MKTCAKEGLFFSLARDFFLLQSLNKMGALKKTTKDLRSKLKNKKTKLQALLHPKDTLNGSAKTRRGTDTSSGIGPSSEFEYQPLSADERQLFDELYPNLSYLTSQEVLVKPGGRKNKNGLRALKVQGRSTGPAALQRLNEETGPSGSSGGIEETASNSTGPEETDPSSTAPEETDPSSTGVVKKPSSSAESSVLHSSAESSTSEPARETQDGSAMAADQYSELLKQRAKQADKLARKETVIEYAKQNRPPGPPTSTESNRVVRPRTDLHPGLPPVSSPLRKVRSVDEGADMSPLRRQRPNPTPKRGAAEESVGSPRKKTVLQPDSPPAIVRFTARSASAKSASAESASTGPETSDEILQEQQKKEDVDWFEYLTPASEPTLAAVETASAPPLTKPAPVVESYSDELLAAIKASSDKEREHQQNMKTLREEKDAANQAAAEAARRADEIRQEMAFSTTNSSVAEPNVVPQQPSIVEAASGGDDGGDDGGSSTTTSGSSTCDSSVDSSSSVDRSSRVPVIDPGGSYVSNQLGVDTEIESEAESSSVPKSETEASEVMETSVDDDDDLSSIFSDVTEASYAPFRSSGSGPMDPRNRAQSPRARPRASATGPAASAYYGIATPQAMFQAYLNTIPADAMAQGKPLRQLLLERFQANQQDYNNRLALGLMDAPPVLQVTPKYTLPKGYVPKHRGVPTFTNAYLERRRKGPTQQKKAPKKK